MKLKFLFLTIAAFAAITASAVPAKRDLRTVTQPDGSTMQIRKIGDEHRHFTLTSDGCLLSEQQGAFYFARLNNGIVENTGVLASDLRLRNAEQMKAAFRPSEEQLSALPTVSRKARRAALPQNGVGLFTNDFPRTGSPKVLVVLVQFKDSKFKVSNPAQYFADHCSKKGFSEYGATGSALDFFTDNSNGVFTPQFDVVGPVTLDNNVAYYGGNDRYGDDKNPEGMVIDACKKLDGTVDFSKYDNDGDRKVDNVYIIYAGQGEASYGSEDTVWPHNWELSDAQKAFTLDGVTIDRYACSNEWEESRPDGIGTFVHEFSHVMGLPDLYSVATEHYATPGEWSVMDYGPYNNDGRTPPNYSIYERNALKWMEPELIDGPMAASIEHIAKSNHGYIIPASGNNEFYLFECRQQSGWDKYLPGHGMLIWHIDFNQSVFDDNTPNDDKSHMRVAIVKANNIAEADPYSSSASSVLAGWAWPGNAKKTEFTDNTTPSMKNWAGKGLGLPITDIKESNGIITFNVDGGPELISVPANLRNSEISADGFTAEWDAVDGATDYLFTLVGVSGQGSESSVTCDMGSGSFKLPEGWTSSYSTTKDCYTSNGNYGQASPSLKLSSSQAFLQSPDLDGDVTSISFWMKGQNTSNSALNVYGKIGGDWKLIETVEPTNNKAVDYAIENIPSGVRAVKFTYTKSAGNLALDDVVITTGSPDTPVADFIEKSTQGKTSIKVSGLSSTSNTYRWCVRATDGENLSRKSADMLVTLGSTSVNEAGVEASIRVSGRTLTVAGAPRMEVFDLTGRTVAATDIPAGASVSFTLPAEGIYIVRAGGVTRKITVK